MRSFILLCLPYCQLFFPPLPFLNARFALLPSFLSRGKFHTQSFFFRFSKLYAASAAPYFPSSKRGSFNFPPFHYWCRSLPRAAQFGMFSLSRDSDFSLSVLSRYPFCPPPFRLSVLFFELFWQAPSPQCFPVGNKVLTFDFV